MTLNLPGMAPPPMPDTIDRALTLTQPWGGLIAAGIKRIENRPWKLPNGMLGRRFAIHASREIDRAVTKKIIEAIPQFCTDPETQPWWRLGSITSAIIGVARIVGCVSSKLELDRAADSDVFPPVGPCFDQGRFWMGPYAFLLSDIEALATPVECKGALGFWGLSESLATRVTAQLKESA